MSIETPSNVHAAATIYAAPDMGPPATSQTPTKDPPTLAELPAFNSLGCSVFDLRPLAPPGVFGAYLVKLDYPLASSQSSVHVTPFGYTAADGSQIGQARSYIALSFHIDDTFKLVVAFATDDPTRTTPVHVVFINFDSIPTVERMIAPSFPVPFPFP